jgi:hypothetical protein
LGKVVTTKKDIESVDERKRLLINILTDLEKANFGMNLFTKRPKARDPLLEHEKPISLLICVGALYEALGKFNSIKGSARPEILQSNHEEVIKCMNFLSGQKIENFRSSILNDIRNKGAFHADPKIVTSYFFNADFADDDEIILWRENEDGSNNYPIANDILGFWFLQVLNSTDFLENTIFLGDIYNNLRTVVHFLLMKWFNAQVIHT